MGVLTAWSKSDLPLLRAVLPLLRAVSMLVLKQGERRRAEVRWRPHWSAGELRTTAEGRPRDSGHWGIAACGDTAVG